MLKGVHRAHHHPRRPLRLPITPDLLRRIYHTWSQMDIDYDKSMLWAAFCLGFFGFLRSGEFTSTTANSNSPDRLSPADIEVDSHINPGCMAVHIRRSKTDPFGVGTTVYLGSTGDVLCPVKAMMAYLALRPSTPGPLFIFHDGKPLTQEQLIIHLRQALSEAGVNASGYSGHSFQIGAATAAANAGLSDSMIKALGRWKSDAFMAYIRTPSHHITAVMSRLAKSPTSLAT